jgi:hypothetical protein
LIFIKQTKNIKNELLIKTNDHEKFKQNNDKNTNNNNNVVYAFWSL